MDIGIDDETTPLLQEKFLPQKKLFFLRQY